MSKFAKKKRKNLFERTSPVTSIPSPLCVSKSINQNINWVQNLVKTSNKCYSDLSEPQNFETSVQLNYDKCCRLDHMSNFTTEEKHCILYYYNNIKK
jgi:hypothetical protein